jgi:hypothetical protein
MLHGVSGGAQALFTNWTDVQPLTRKSDNLLTHAVTRDDWECELHGVFE